MDAKLIHAEAVKFSKQLGPDGELFISISGSKYRQKAIHCSVYPRGMSGRSAISLDADDWAEMFAMLREEWAKHSDEYERTTIQEMALEIIRLTAAGNCTDAALSGDKFTAAEVKKYGPRACDEANKMASNGPFVIATLKNRNVA